MKRSFLVGMAALATLGLIGIPAQQSAQAFEESAILLQFDPKKDDSSRYMFQLIMSGTHVTPGVKDDMLLLLPLPPEYQIGTIFKDTVMDSKPGQNHHRINFYNYKVRSINWGIGDRNDPRFGGSNFNLPPESGEGGDAQGFSGSFVPNLNLPPAQRGGGGGAGVQGGGPGNGGGGGVAPMQVVGGDGGGGGGGSAGGGDSSIRLDSILVNQIDYVTNKQGEILDVGGLDLLRKVSQNRLVGTNPDDEAKKRTDYIDVNISHIFEWSHMLYLPPYPVFKEDLWFHSMPVHVPGLPYDQPVLTKFMYKLIDFRKVGTRKVAVIDMSGVCEWNHEWENESREELTEFKSWGNMGFSARYWFDYEKNMVFGIERPPFWDYQYNKGVSGYGMFYPYNPFEGFAMRFPGLAVSMEFFYNTRVTDISGRPRLVEIEPKVERRYIVMNFLCQLEAE